MWYRLHAIDEGPGTRRLCHGADGLDVVNSAREITGTTNANEFGFVGNQLLQFVQFEFERFQIERQPLDFEIEVSCKQHPWRDVCVVVHARQDYFVAR